MMGERLDPVAMERALQNCYLLAGREVRRHHKGLPPRPEMWDHVLRFCTEGGMKADFLRGMGTPHGCGGDRMAVVSDLQAAESRLRILWGEGGTMDAAYGTNLSAEGQLLYRFRDLETLARAYLAGPAAAVRDAERAALGRAAEACEQRRLAILADPDDPSWTEHFAELAAAIRALAPAADGAWSKEPPAVPGYWWWRLSESHGPEIVSLLRYGDRLLIGHVFGADASKTEGEWAGPLIPPPDTPPRPESPP